MRIETAPNRTPPAAADYEGLFSRVSRPSRYIGGEWNSLRKSKSFRDASVGICLCFPDLYETGFANTGIEILYHLVNRRTDAYAERAYCPDSDLATALRGRGWPLFSLETRTPISRFDVVGFGLPYELCYSNVLEMLDLSQIPLRAADRDERHPLVIGGGPCAVNPEPIAPFFDAIVIGDGEDVLQEVLDVVREHKRQSPPDRPSLLRKLARLEGLYVPSLYEVAYGADGTIQAVTPRAPEAPEQVLYRRSALEGEAGDLPRYPTAPVVPFVQTVHDRLNVEIQRGCPWRCRFCQAGFSYRPYRERSLENLVQIVEKGLKSTGYDAITLAGLSAADHREIIPLLQTLAARLTPKRIAIGLPSTRADRFTLALAEILYAVRRQSITFAPEGGTERMRRVIRKELQETEIRQTLRLAQAHGWKNAKLYFMYGLPTETREDLDGILRLVRDSRRENPGLALTLTLSPFVPKPHTPYQWHPQDRLEVLREKLSYLRKNLKAQVRAHGLEQIVVEGVLARGDRRCADLLETVWRRGGKFEEWGERFRFDLWTDAFRDCGLSPDFYCHRERPEKEVLPWDHLQGGPDKRALWNDYRTALRQAVEPVPEHPHLKERPGVSPAPRPALAPEKTVQRVRFKMSRRGSVRFLSHLEQIEMVRRMLRRAEVPVAHTSGFHPQMKIAFGPAISVGYESDCEYFEAELTRRVELDPLWKAVAAQAPEGTQILRCSRVPLFFPSLEALINRVDYEVGVPRDLSEGNLERWLENFSVNRGRGDLVLQKKKEGKVVTIPLAPVLLRAEWSPALEDGPSVGVLSLALRLGPGKNAKPEKVAELLFGLKEEEAAQLRVLRKALTVVKQDGEPVEP